MEPIPDGPAVLPPGLRTLQRLVLGLIGVMIVGFVVLVGAFLWRLNAPAPILPPAVTLPDGSARPVAFTMAGDWFAVVTADDRILIYDRLTGRLRQTLAVE